MKTLFLALGLVGLAVAPALSAEMDFEIVDSDGSGLVWVEEAAAAGWEWTDEEFEEADTDGDGYLNVEEFNAATG